jgi:hypothetical protein
MWQKRKLIQETEQVSERHAVLNLSFDLADTYMEAVCGRVAAGG